MKVVLDHWSGGRLPQVVVFMVHTQQLILPHSHGSCMLGTTLKVVGSKGMLQYSIGYHRLIGRTRHSARCWKAEGRTRRGGYPVAVEEIGKHIVWESKR